MILAMHFVVMIIDINKYLKIFACLFKHKCKFIDVL